MSPIVASDKPVGDVSETLRRRPAKRWRGTTASAPGNAFRRPSQSADGRMEASDAGPSLCPPKPERRLSPPAPLSMGTGIKSSALGWIKLTMCVSSGVLPRLIVLHFRASVTRRGPAFYGSDPQSISIQPSGTRAAEADPRPCQPPRHVHPRVEQLLRRLHAWNAEEPLAGKSTRQGIAYCPIAFEDVR